MELHHEGETTIIHHLDQQNPINIQFNGGSDFKTRSQNLISQEIISMMIIPPHSHLPKPEPPPGLSPPTERSVSLPENFDNHAAAFGKFLRDKSNSFSEAITKRISSLKNDSECDESVTEFKLFGVKVTKSLKDINRDYSKLKGRISFFSRSNCRDCGAVRSFLRQKELNFVEINVDVYPGREKELVERTGSSAVPQIFFNDKLIGGLVVLNSLRNSGILEKKLEEMLSGKCPDNAPEVPVYGFDDAAEVAVDEMAVVVRVVRQKVPIQDRIRKLKIVNNCFSGAELVEALIHHFDCGRKKAVEIGKQLARKHFIHHVFGENQFEDGNHLYRFLEHESYIPKSHNFRGSVNDCEPTTAAAVSQRITNLMSAVLESYASDDRCNLDYIGISNSEEFRRYVNLVEDLQRVDLMTLSEDEKLTFFVNMYNAMAIHAVIRIGNPEGMMERRSFFSEFIYVIGGYPYSLSSIRDGILRNNRRPPLSLIKPFSGGDKRVELCCWKVNQLIHFGISNASKGSPSVKFFTPKSIESELRCAAREFLLREDGMRVDLAKRTVYLSRIIKWYAADFGQEKGILKWIINYLDASKAGLLTHLLNDGGPIQVVYPPFDWSLNSSSHLSF